MEWRDEGVLLSMRPHGEGSAIIEVLTAAHGRHMGVVRGGASRKMAAVLQPGTQIAVEWRARLDNHMGAFTAEPLRSRAAVLEDPLGLSGLGSVCALLHHALPEREPHAHLYRQTIALQDAMVGGQDWGGAYLSWEMSLLEEIGFGLSLGSCAVTGSREDLAYVSPKTGRAVSRDGAGEWASRLLPMPACMLGQGPASTADLLAGLAITAHFLTRELAPQLKAGPLPEARGRMISRLQKRGG